MAISRWPCHLREPPPEAVGHHAHWLAASSRSFDKIEQQAQERRRGKMEQIRHSVPAGKSGGQLPHPQPTTRRQHRAAEERYWACLRSSGAEAGTRTLTGVLPLRPERSASTYSATSARSRLKYRQTRYVQGVV